MNNPYGSTAGAGSGDFHVYRHARAREMERWKNLNAEEKEKALDSEFQKKRDAEQKEEERKTEQRRRKRQRHKEAKKRKRNLELSGFKVAAAKEDEAPLDEDEFKYDPVNEQKEPEKPAKPQAVTEFANDGSFLELMKAKLAKEAELKQKDENGQATKDSTEDEPPTKKQASSLA